MSELVKGIRSPMVASGVGGSTNRRLKLQDGGKKEADTAAVRAVSWAMNSTLAAPARLDALIWRKSEIMDIFLHR
jgi:hypothetical protein